MQSPEIFALKKHRRRVVSRCVGHELHDEPWGGFLQCFDNRA